MYWSFSTSFSILIFCYYCKYFFLYWIEGLVVNSSSFFSIKIVFFFQGSLIKIMICLFLSFCFSFFYFKLTSTIENDNKWHDLDSIFVNRRELLSVSNNFLWIFNCSSLFWPTSFICFYLHFFFGCCFKVFQFSCRTFL